MEPLTLHYAMRRWPRRVDAFLIIQCQRASSISKQPAHCVACSYLSCSLRCYPIHVCVVCCCVGVVCVVQCGSACVISFSLSLSFFALLIKRRYGAVNRVNFSRTTTISTKPRNNRRGEQLDKKVWKHCRHCMASIIWSDNSFLERQPLFTNVAV